ncbi:putative ester cyclase [Motilibacter peucedani]|uniref:Putative ester cyclase n=1 Tax=Motilibacter peucedani TaxID=598650 RepID=A0A420XUS9_9ACTN|nr:ester cyclase [Motilibacter peucedani]RKS80409.1 putative ester cyclase [Motilibacter peucedani]
MAPDRSAMLALYERYLACCNAHRADDLGEFVSQHVSGSGPVDGLAAYIESVREVYVGFPDYRWEVQDVFVDGRTIVARLFGSGTNTGTFSGIAPTGRRIRTQELVVYQVEDGKIAHCWGDLHPVVRDALSAVVRAAG